MLFACDASQISKAVDYVRDELRKRRIRSEGVTRAMLAAEEILNAMIRHAPSAEESVNVRVVSLMRNTSVWITCRGTAFDLSEVQSSLQTGGDPETDVVISDLFNRIMSNTLSLKNRNGINYASLQVAAPRYRHLLLTLGSLAAGILVGILLRKILPEGVNAAINTNLFTPVSTMFLNALKMVVAPLVLFSIASSVAEFNDLRSLGRIAARILGGYSITSVIAIFVGLAVWLVFPIGDPVLKNAVTASGSAIVTQAQNTSVSLIDTVVNIVPKDIISPFVSLDMLQIIFIAVMTGIAAGMLSARLQVFRTFLNECNMIFSRITAMIISLMPLAVFCNMAKLMQTMQLGQLASVLPDRGPGKPAHVLPEVLSRHADGVYPRIEQCHPADLHGDLRDEARDFQTGLFLLPPAGGNHQHGRHLHHPHDQRAVHGKDLRRPGDAFHDAHAVRIHLRAVRRGARSAGSRAHLRLHPPAAARDPAGSDQHHHGPLYAGGHDACLRERHGGRRHYPGYGQGGTQAGPGRFPFKGCIKEPQR